MRIIDSGLLIVSVTVLTIVSAPIPAAADDREIQVNSYTTLSTFFPVVESLDNGGFVVVWRGRHGAGTDQAIVGRRLDAQSLPVGDEFRVDIATSGLSLSSEPEIEKLSDGRLLIAWNRFSDPIFRFMSSDGSPVGGEFKVADQSVLAQVAIAPAPAGGFLVAWDCFDSCGEDWDTLVQRFDSAGQPFAEPAFVHVATSGVQLSPQAISLGSNGFLVVWRDAQASADHLRMRRLDANGEFVGGETNLDVPIDSFVDFAVAGEGGRFVAALSEFGEEERDTISLFRFDTLGNRIGQEFVVSAGEPYQLLVERVNMNASGHIDVLGRKVTLAGPNNLNRDVALFQFDFDTGLQAANFQVNSLRADDQYLADSARTDDTFLVVWASEGSLGDDDMGYSIQARSSFDAMFIDGFESGRLEQWHQVASPVEP